MQDNQAGREFPHVSPLEFQSVSSALSRSIPLLALASCCSMTVQRMCDPMLPALAQEFHRTIPEVAWVISLFAVTYGLMQIVYGPLADRIGKFRVVAFTTLMCSVGCIASALAPDLGWLVASRVLVAAFAAAVIPVTMAWVGDNTPYDIRQETLARVGLGTMLGLVSGQIIGGVFTDTAGWRWGFGFVGVVFLLTGATMWIDPRARAGAERRLSADPSAVPVTDRQPPWRQALEVLSQPRPRRLLGTVLLHGASLFGAIALVASHLHESLNISLTHSGILAGLFGLGGVLYMLMARHLIRRLGTYGLCRTGGGLVVVSLATIAYSPWWPLVALASLLSGLGFSMFHNTLQAHASEMAPRMRGIGMSLFAGTLFTGQSIGVVVASSLSASLGMGAVIALGGCSMLMLALAFPTLMRHAPARAD
jgi:predicted MFS family arabinose efflux permease